MYEGCFIQTRLSNTLNISTDQKTWPSMQRSLWNAKSIFLKTSPSFINTRQRFWVFKGKVKARRRVWKNWLSVWKVQPLVCIIAQPVLPQSATVKYDKETTTWMNVSHTWEKDRGEVLEIEEIEPKKLEGKTRRTRLWFWFFMIFAIRGYTHSVLQLKEFFPQKLFE